MERIVRSATQGPGPRTLPRERRRSRLNRKSCGCCVCAQIWSKTRNAFATFVFIIVNFLSWPHSKEDTEERLDDRRGKCSWLVRWFRAAGVRKTAIMLDIKTTVGPFTALYFRSRLETHPSLAWHSSHSELGWVVWFTYCDTRERGKPLRKILILNLWAGKIALHSNH